VLTPRAPHEQLGARTWTGERLGVIHLPAWATSQHVCRPSRGNRFACPNETGDDLTDEEILRGLAAAFQEGPTEDTRAQGAPASYQDNPYFDTIVRLPSGDIDRDVPLGIVSKRYRLVPYAELIDVVGAGLAALDLGDWESFDTHV
jgi:hypothetical protein